MIPGFMPRNHPNTVKRRGVDDSIDDRETPPCVYVPLHAEFQFTLDVAASHENRKCDRYCTKEGAWSARPGGPPVPIRRSTTMDDGDLLGDGLHYPWAGERVWCNPPFSNLRLWVERAWDELAELAVVLVPNNRSEQPWWQKQVEPYRDRPGSILTTRHLPKRRPFLYRGAEIGNSTSKNPPFGLVLVIWDRRRPVRGH